MTNPADGAFLERFFSAPNNVWPDRDPAVGAAVHMEPFLPALARQGECPLILPRRDAGWHAAHYYVICWDTAHAGRIRPLIQAATAANWAPFDGRVVRLDRADPVEAAVLDRIGPNTTFVLRPSPETATHTYTALRRLAMSLSGVPQRRSVPPRPIGRMLREFDLALASGAAESSARILREIETMGGISHENVAFLQIKRLSRLGRDAELLAHGLLPTLVYAEPPRLVREGVLGAWARAHFPRPLAADDLDRAISSVSAANPDVAMLVDVSLADSIDPDVATLVGIVSLARHDEALQFALSANTAVDRSVRQRLNEGPNAEPQGQRAVAGTPAVPPQSAAPVESVLEARAHEETIGSWLDWTSAVRAGTAARLEYDQVRYWAPLHGIDADLADAIDDLPELATDDLLSGVALFLEVDVADQPAPRSAEALLRRYLLAERYLPQDIGAICSLLEIILRGAPDETKYREVLGDIRAAASRWVSIALAERALDLGDVVALGPAVDLDARADLMATLFAPLNQQKRRLSAPLRGLAQLVTNDVGLDLDWSIPESTSSDADPARALSPRILLYSLDGGTLARVSEAVQHAWPRAVVRISSDKVGSSMLKQHASSSDLVVVATRRAAHAATGCIADNRGSALIRYPDGAGSASMMRAVEAGIAELSR